ncbi:hypothetical protein C4D60_Mb04t11540 [Musa balbisiana]|uniref:4-hydroxy-4-methyl-2-oxoglutarate aldolase n=1 Tax=Musa balbisiana TaxID=52838 RepID=A0A4S8KBC5_MUSBA|nr:hypothetical protein C4D60_Mb04t11540 [Musa balbisiana]
MDKVSNVVLDIECLTQPTELCCTGSPKMTKVLSRKGSIRMEKHNGEEQKADDALKKLVIKVPSLPEQPLKQPLVPFKSFQAVQSVPNSPVFQDMGEGRAMAALQLATAEVCDANPHLILSGELRALHPIFQIYGRRQVFSGPIVTLKVFEDNVLVREFLEEKGNGRVLVVDGGGSMRCAILGGNPVQQAQNNGWAGIVVNGCIRDVDEINGCDIGVRALASHPMKANKKGIGEKHAAINVAGTRICDGEWLYADTDGILVSRTELTV